MDANEVNIVGIMCVSVLALVVFAAWKTDWPNYLFQRILPWIVVISALPGGSTVAKVAFSIMPLTAISAIIVTIMHERHNGPNNLRLNNDAYWKHVVLGILSLAIGLAIPSIPWPAARAGLIVIVGLIGTIEIFIKVD